MKKLILITIAIVCLYFTNCKTSREANSKNWIAVDTTYVIDGTEIYTTKYIYRGK